MNRPSIPAETFVNGSQMQMMQGGSLAVPGWPPIANFNAPVSTEETIWVGIMGEHFVCRIPFTHIPSLLMTKKRVPASSEKIYKELIRLLHDFGPDNWTSELRHSIPGFTPFSGRAFADFTYSDRQGQLTRAWFGAEIATAMNGHWPRYHIEVKSTRGEENEPFHMSREQMSTVRVLLPRSVAYRRLNRVAVFRTGFIFLVGTCVRGA